MDIITLSNLSVLTSGPLVIPQQVKTLCYLSSFGLSDSEFSELLSIITLWPVLLTALGTGLMTVNVFVMDGLPKEVDTVIFITDTIVMIMAVLSLLFIGLVIFLLVTWFLWLRNGPKYYYQYILRLFTQ